MEFLSDIKLDLQGTNLGKNVQNIVILFEEFRELKALCSLDLDLRDTDLGSN